MAVAFAASPASAQLGAEAQRIYDDFQQPAPQRAFAVAADGRATSWAAPTAAIRAVRSRA
jgi:hypothetical protein